MDVSNENQVKHFFEKSQITHVINCAAYTAVDRAESEKEKADLINHLSVRNLGKICKEKNIKLIHISTDYIFDGTNYEPYREENLTKPQSVYGKTKLDGENALKDLNHGTVIRTSWVYSEFGKNFLKTMLKLGKERDELGIIFDQVGTPTYAKDLAKIILDNLDSIRNEKTEVYHYSNEGVCSWYDFAKAIFELSNISCNVKPLETKEYPTPAKRPSYSLLNKSKIKKDFNIEIPYWRDSLKECLIKLGEIK